MTRQGGADHNKATLVEGATPLHWAAVHGHVQMAKLLLEARAELAPRIVADSVDSVVPSGYVKIAIENGPFSSLIYLLNMVIFHSYVSLPEGILWILW